MNIFVTNQDPVLSAQALDDLRLNKMILESAQMLCTVAPAHNVPAKLIAYKPTHINHPCTVWIRNKANYDWLARHFLALVDEKTDRTHKIHLSYQKLAPMLQWLYGPGMVPRCSEDISFVYCGDYHVLTNGTIDVIASYRSTMHHKWQDDLAKGRQPRWTNTTPPEWYEGVQS